MRLQVDGGERRGLADGHHEGFPVRGAGRRKHNIWGTSYRAANPGLGSRGRCVSTGWTRSDRECAHRARALRCQPTRLSSNEGRVREWVPIDLEWRVLEEERATSCRSQRAILVHSVVGQ